MVHMDDDEDDFFAIDQLVAAHQSKKVLVIDLLAMLMDDRMTPPPDPPPPPPPPHPRPCLPPAIHIASARKRLRDGTVSGRQMSTHGAFLDARRSLCSPRLRLSVAMLQMVMHHPHTVAGHLRRNTSGRPGKARRQMAPVAATAPSRTLAHTSAAAGRAWGRCAHVIRSLCMQLCLLLHSCGASSFSFIAARLCTMADSMS